MSFLKKRNSEGSAKSSNNRGVRLKRGPTVCIYFLVNWL